MSSEAIEERDESDSWRRGLRCLRRHDDALCAPERAIRAAAAPLASGPGPMGMLPSSRRRGAICSAALASAQPQRGPVKSAGLLERTQKM